jgi:virulence factor Mce-like protein
VSNSPLQSVLRNPTLVGAVTVLIVILAVFLAYNANSGLPFVATYRLTAEVPNAASLVPGNEVRIGGDRVGIVEDIFPLTEEDGGNVAALVLKLDRDVDPLPVNSTVVVRARSALGLKYLEINRGDSDEGFPEGGTIPVGQATPMPVELDELLNTFDTPTREALRVNLEEIGGTLAGRGPDLNEAIGGLEPLLPRLERVTRVLSARDTQLGRFVRALNRTTAALAPIAETGANAFVALDRSFAAFAAIARPFLQETLSRSPATLSTATETLPRIRPFLVNSRKLFVDLQPGAAVLAESGPTIEAALKAGIPALRTADDLSSQLAPTAASLLTLTDDPVSRLGIDRLTELGDSLSPPLRFIAPAQSVCNYATLLFRNLTNLTGEGNEFGSFLRGIPLEPPEGPNNEGSPSSAPADGGEGSKPRLGVPINFLHANPYPNTAAPQQEVRECEAGNEPYAVGEQVIGNTPGNQGIVTEDQTNSQLKGSG